MSAANVHYIGQRQTGNPVSRADASGTAPLAPRLDVKDWCDGTDPEFDWGFNGYRCKQLALAICCDALGDTDRALRVHERYARCVIADLGWARGFVLTHAEVIATIEGIERETGYIERTTTR